jgi:hypothetical protein
MRGKPRVGTKEVEAVEQRVPASLQHDIVEYRSNRVMLRWHITIPLVEIEEVQSILTLTLAALLRGHSSRITLAVVIYILVQIAYTLCITHELCREIAILGIAILWRIDRVLGI